MNDFDAFAQNFGGVMQPPAGSIADKFLELMKEVIAERSAGDIKDGALSRLELGFVQHEEFGAWAGRNGDTDVIAIAQGTYPLLWNIFCAVLTQRETLDILGLGDVAQGPIKFSDKITSVPMESRDFFSEVQFPNMDQRIAIIARDLSEGAMLYIVFHELAHIRNGHIDWLGKQFNISVLNEIPHEYPETDTHGLARQTMEWDADLAAVQDILNIILLPSVDSSAIPSKWKIPETNNFGSFDQALVFASMIVSIIHIFFSSIEEIRQDEIFERSHPPFVIRYISCCVQIAHILSLRAGMDTEAVLPLVMKGAEALRAGLTQCLPGVNWGFKSDIDLSELSDLYNGVFEREWARIHPELDTMKRGGILAPMAPHL